MRGWLSVYKHRSRTAARIAVLLFLSLMFFQIHAITACAINITTLTIMPDEEKVSSQSGTDEDRIAYYNAVMSSDWSEVSYYWDFTDEDFWKLLLDTYFSSPVTVEIKGEDAKFTLPAISPRGELKEHENTFDYYASYNMSISAPSMSFTGAEAVNRPEQYRDSYYDAATNSSIDRGIVDTTLLVYDFTLDAPVTIVQNYDYSNSDDSGLHESKRHTEERAAISDIEASVSVNVDDTGKIWYQSVSLKFNAEISVDVTSTYTDGSSDGFSDTDSIDVWYFPSFIKAVSDASGTPADQEVTEHASETEGETGTDIKPEIIGDPDEPAGADEGGLSLPAAIGAGAGATAAAGAGAAAAASAGSGNKPDADDERKKRYRMFVAKDFGDTIRKGARPVAVKARIAEVMGQGMPMSRADLSSRIQITGEGINISSVTFDGTYMVAYIYADEESTAKEGKVIFTYAGEGGTFRNNVIFKLAGKAYLRFPEANADGSKWVLHSDAKIGMIAGDGQTYHVMFYFEDAIGEPKLLKFECDDDLKVRATRADRIHTYYADIDNKTADIETESIFETRVVKKTIRIHAEFENGDIVEGNIDIDLYPEGISVQVKDEDIEDGRLLINAFEDDIYYGDDVEPTPRFMPVRMIVKLAVSTPQGAEIIDADEAKMKFDRMTGDEGINAALAEKYDYELDRVGSEYTLVSKVPIVEGEKPFILDLPGRCSYQGKEYSALIPVRIKGAKPQPISDEQKEFKKLIYAVKRYIDDGERQYYWIMFIKEKMSNGRVSAYTLRMMWWSVYYEYYDNEVSYGEALRCRAEMLEWAISGTKFVQWVCSVAFSYAAEAYTGSPVAGAFVQMAYDFVMDSVEELTDAYKNDRSFNVDNLEAFEHIKKAGDNIAESMLTDSLKIGKPGMMTKNAMYIGAYFGYLVVKNFIDGMHEDGQLDLPGAIYGAFKDMTATMFKVVAGHLFKYWIKSRKFQRQAGKVISKGLRKRFKARTGPAKVKKMALAKKYIEETVGEGTNLFFDTAEAVYDRMDLDFGPTGNILIRFCLCEGDDDNGSIWVQLDLNKALEYTASTAFAGPFVLMYDFLFGNLEGAKGIVTFPEDPKQVRRNRMKERLDPKKLYGD